MQHLNVLKDIYCRQGKGERGSLLHAFASH